MVTAAGAVWIHRTVPLWMRALVMSGLRVLHQRVNRDALKANPNSKNQDKCLGPPGEAM